MVAFDLASGLAVGVVALPQADSAQLYCRFTSPRFTSTAGGADRQFDRLASELKQGFFVTITAGKLAEIRVASVPSRFAESIVRTVAAAFQFSGPRQANALKWKTEELDATGRYTIEYTPGRNSEEILRRKESYAPVEVGITAVSPTNAQLSTAVVKSEGSVLLSPARLGIRDLKKVQYREHLKTQMTSTAALSSVTTLELTLQGKAGTKDSASWAQVLASTTILGSGNRVPSPSDQFDVSRIGAFTYESALRALEAQGSSSPAQPNELPDASTSRIRAASDAFGAMTALLRSRPGLVETLERRIRGGAKNQNVLMDALSSADSARGQAALVSLMDDTKLTESLRRDAAFSLIRTPTPTVETVDALKRHAESGILQVHALYGLGTFSRRLREAGEAARAAEIAHLLMQLLAKASTPSIQVHVLRGIANSGHPEALTSVKPLLYAPSTKVRAAAVDAIRLMPGDEVEQLIAAQLMGTNPEAQLAAVDAIAVREPSAPLLKALTNGGPVAEKPSTRMRAIAVMLKWLPSHPELRKVLEQMARDDVNPHVREAATKASMPG